MAAPAAAACALAIGGRHAGPASSSGRQLGGLARPAALPAWRRVGPRATRGRGAPAVSAAAPDPFAAAPAAAAGRPQQAPIGFRAESTKSLPLMEIAAADELFVRFDREQRICAGGATESHASAEQQADLRAAAITLSASAGNVMMGICAPSAAAAVQTLKDWVSALGLPRGRLHGMDRDGVPIDLPGSVFIKYNSASGDANISGYMGRFRGVLFTPGLPDGRFRQYGYLPLACFRAGAAEAGAGAAAAAAGAGPGAGAPGAGGGGAQGREGA